MNPAIRNEFLHRELRDLPPNGIVARDDYRLRRVVDDQVDAGGGLDGPDVAALAADEPAFHVVGRKVHDRDGSLCDELSREPFDRQRDDLLGATIGIGPRLFLDHANPLGGFVPRRRRDLGEQGCLRLLSAHSGSPLEHLPRRFGRLLEFHLELLRGRFPLAERGLAPPSIAQLALHRRRALFDLEFARSNLLLGPLQLPSLIPRLDLELLTEAQEFVAGTDLGFPLRRLGLPAGLRDDPLALFFSCLSRAFGLGPTRQEVGNGAERRDHEAEQTGL